MVEDCFTSGRLDLQLPCPNAILLAEAGTAGADDVGADIAGGDKYLPNPAYAAPGVSARARPLFEFLGRLAGLSLRTKLACAFEWPSLVWKGLVGAPLDMADLRAIDVRTHDLLCAVASWVPPDSTALYAAEGAAGSRTPTGRTPLLPGQRSPSTPFLMRPPATPGSTPAGLLSPAPLGKRHAYSPAAEAAFAAAFPSLHFSARGYDGRVTELMPSGGKLRVTLASRWQFIAAAAARALTSVEPLIRHIRRGLYSVVPPRAVRMLTWRELETAVAGKPEVDLRLLRAHTDYEGYRVTDPTITFFWRALESFTQEERCLFIRFAWGRVRLPTGRRWPKRFKITRRSAADVGSLPLAHTCFFSVEIPPYPTEERMRSALLAAVHYGAGGILNA
jgi:hypothetical protein